MRSFFELFLSRERGFLLFSSNQQNYDGLIHQAEGFAKSLESQGFHGALEGGISESRFIGTEGSAHATYERNRRYFYGKEKALVRPDKFRKRN